MGSNLRPPFHTVLETNILSEGLIPKNQDCKSQSLCVQMQPWLCALLRQSLSSWGNNLVLKQSQQKQSKQYKPQCISSDLLRSPSCKVLLSVPKITLFSPMKHETFLISVSFLSRKRKHVLLKMAIRNCFLSQKKSFQCFTSLTFYSSSQNCIMLL